MSFLQDKINKIMAYFDTEDLEQEEYEYGDSVEEELPRQQLPAQDVQRPAMIKEERVATMSNPSQISALPQREQASYARPQQTTSEMTKIDIKFPKKTEEARDIVNLLLQNVSVLIDFQHMTDSQARRCIDYLDGARFVLNGNLKKISSTMFLLTPVNVEVNIEDMGLRGEVHEANNYDYDMKRR